MKKVAVLLGIAILTGCSLAPETLDPLNQTKNNKELRVQRNLTVTWDNIGRGGAAMRQPGYIHVLGASNVNTVIDQASTSITPDKSTLPKKNLDSDISEALDALNSIKMKQGYSLYELSRWERYCDSGKGMDEVDWMFVESETTSNLPINILTSCNSPKHSYKEYLSVWERFCAGKTISKEQRLIVKNTVRPNSMVNSCNALK